MAGLVPSLSRPGGNLTGVNYMQSELGAKRMGLLHEMVPLASRFTLAASSRPPPPSSAMNSRRLLSSIGDFLPYALRRRLARALSLPHLPSLPQGGRQVLGTDLNRSESRGRRPAPRPSGASNVTIANAGSIVSARKYTNALRGSCASFRAPSG